ncbi:MAG: HD domain-containing protein [Selenomonadaceae bacterium]|nr:HD domain-containing protein [Selenomonadaceae bacterium]MBP3721639.1 HD domain-containing protein [Selenomonadaceae bacterium]
MRAVSVEDLKEGAILARSVVNDDMIVVISEGTELTKAHITRLGFLNIPVVYVKDEYELSKNFQAASAVFSKSNAFVKDYGAVVNIAKEIFSDMDAEKEKKSAAAHAVVDSAITPLTKSSGVIDYLFDISHMASDLYQHSLRVSIMAGVIGKWMRYDAMRQKEITLAGFMHDVGKTKIEDRVLGKNIDKLQGEDLETYRNHTELGYQILESMPNITEGVKRAAREHHERMDGSGFPHHLKGSEIHIYSSIVALADFYDNTTTEREGYVKQTPFDAIGYITENLYTTLDPTVCIPFLTHIKDAFVGSRVTLNSGVTGYIAAFPSDFAAFPVVSADSGEMINLNHAPGVKIIEYNPKE